MKDNKLDKFFREKSEENLPEFDPKYWEQAERMLDDALPVEEDRKRGAWWWWLPLLLIGGCGVCWFSPLGKNGDWMNRDRNVLTDSENLNKQDKSIGKIDFENTTQNTNVESEVANENTDNEPAKIVNSTKNNSNSLKSEIVNIGQNNAQKGVSQKAFNEPVFTNLKANSISKESSHVPTNAPEIVKSEIDKTQDLGIAAPPTDKDEKWGRLASLTTSDVDFLESPLTEIENSLTIDSVRLQKLVKSKKLRLGWSAEAVVREELIGDYIATTVASVRTGLTMDYKLSKRWDLHFDLLGRRETSESVKFVNVTEPQGGKAYGFGVTEITNLYRFKTQYFVEGVGLFRYKLHERHALGAGIGVKYLLSVQADLIQRRKEAVFNFENYSVFFDNRDEVIDSGWWEKESTRDLLPFAQLRYDFRPSRNFTLFFKLNGEYNIGWYLEPLIDEAKTVRLETSFGVNYQF